MQNTSNSDYRSRSVLTSLRRLIPDRRIEFTEALRIAELQANRLLELTGDDPAALDQAIARSRRIRIEYRQMPTSGLSYWDGHVWIVCLNNMEPATRQRFTMLHEYKHIIDHGSTDKLFTGSRDKSAAEQAEQTADYFAGCALMPKRQLKQAWSGSIQCADELAAMFHVSVRAVEVRLVQTGLVEPTRRCSPPTAARIYSYDRPSRLQRRIVRYERSVSTSWAPTHTLDSFGLRRDL